MAPPLFTAVLIFSALLATSCGAVPAPTIFFPAPSSAGACLDTPLRLTFQDPVVLGDHGRILIYGSADHLLVDRIDLADLAPTNSFGGKVLRYDPIHVAGNVASIQLHAHALRPRETYEVIIDAGVFAHADALTWKFSTRAALPKDRNRLTVAADGSGDFCTPQGAIDHVPDDNQAAVEIFVREGEYYGVTYVPRDKDHIRIIGEDRARTILAGRNNDRLNPGRIGRALFAVDANDFELDNMTLRNTTPYGGSQAEALSVKGDHIVLRDDNFYSFQDTLLLTGRVYATNCLAEGDVDFIWGQGGVFFDRCEFKAVHKGYYLQARNPANQPGYVFYHCRLTAAPEVTRCFLARIDADRFPCSEAVYINCEMPPQVPPGGWEIKGTNTSHLHFFEYHSIDSLGKIIDTSGRNSASRQLSEREAGEWSNPAKVLSHQQLWNPWGAQISNRNAQKP